MTAAPALPAFRLAAQPCPTPGCPCVLSTADGAGPCLACRAEHERAANGRSLSLDVCVQCGSNPKKPGERYCQRCMAKNNHAYYVRRKGQLDRAAGV